MRVVSLLPSATEIVYALGHGDSLVGVSHECDFPENAKTKPKMIEPIFDTSRLGSEEIDALVVEYMKQGKSIYRIRFEELKRADPDLIITQELCDVCAIGAGDVLEAVNRLGKVVTVLSLNPHKLTDVQSDIRSVADALGCRSEAERLISILAHMLHPELFDEPLDPKLGTNVAVAAEA
jgi:iron complex transport system substrate-binding protein